jgi:hypothetical protein
MNIPDELFINIVERAEIIFDNLLKKLSNQQILALKNELDNLPIDQYITNQLIIDRINFLKNKNKNFNLDINKYIFDNPKINTPSSCLSSGELEFIENL